MSNPKTFFGNLFEGINKRAKKIFYHSYSKVNINWFFLKYLKHLPANKLHWHNLFGSKTFFYGGPEYLHGLEEIFIGNIYNQILPENATILDCGAHIGLSVIYLKQICPSANIIAFEPDPKNYQLLSKNIVSHKLRTIQANQEAVWVENTTLSFIQDGTMGSKIGSNSTINTIEVKAIRLKDHITKKIDFLKLDIEGAEYRVLTDIAENLYLVINMFIEYHGKFEQNKELIEIFEIVRKSGFKFYIKEAANNYGQPFFRTEKNMAYDIQLNIFCFRN